MKQPDWKAMKKAFKNKKQDQEKPSKRTSWRTAIQHWCRVRRSTWQKTHSPAHRRAWSQVQTVGCVVLLVLNLLLLGVSGAAKGQELLAEHQMRRQMDAILAQQGILCGSSVYHTMETCPQAYTLRADSSVQKTFARNLLTGSVVTIAKGSNTQWEGDNGTVEWSQSGAVHAEVELHAVVIPQSEEEAESIVKDMLEQAGIAVRQNQLSVTQDEAGYIVEVKQEINKTELVDCGLTVTIAEGNLFTIEGVWCTGTAEPVTIRALENYSASKAMFQFVASQGAVGQIISVQPAYVLSDKSGGRFTTIPCWRFSTDSGDFVLNILTGNVVTASDLTPADTVDTGTEADGQDPAQQPETNDGEPDEEQPVTGGVTDSTDDGQTDAVDDPVALPEENTDDGADSDQDIPYDEQPSYTGGLWDADG